MLGIKPEENQGKSSLRNHFQLQFVFFQVINRNANSPSQKVPDNKILVLIQLPKKKKSDQKPKPEQN